MKVPVSKIKSVLPDLYFPHAREGAQGPQYPTQRATHKHGSRAVFSPQTSADVAELRCIVMLLDDTFGSRFGLTMEATLTGFEPVLPP